MCSAGGHNVSDFAWIRCDPWAGVLCVEGS